MLENIGLAFEELDIDEMTAGQGQGESADSSISLSIVLFTLMLISANA